MWRSDDAIHPGYKKLSSVSEQQKSAAMDMQKSSVLKEGFLVKRVSCAFYLGMMRGFTGDPDPVPDPFFSLY